MAKVVLLGFENAAGCRSHRHQSTPGQRVVGDRLTRGEQRQGDAARWVLAADQRLVHFTDGHGW
jgi:hypothetical protein